MSGSFTMTGPTGRRHTERSFREVKVRYRGLAKNTTRVYAVFALANLYRVRRKPLPHGV